MLGNGILLESEDMLFSLTRKLYWTSKKEKNHFGSFGTYRLPSGGVAIPDVLDDKNRVGGKDETQ